LVELVQLNSGLLHYAIEVVHESPYMMVLVQDNFPPGETCLAAELYGASSFEQMARTSGLASREIVGPVFPATIALGS